MQRRNFVRCFAVALVRGVAIANLALILASCAKSRVLLNRVPVLNSSGAWESLDNIDAGRSLTCALAALGKAGIPARTDGTVDLNTTALNIQKRDHDKAIEILQQDSGEKHYYAGLPVNGLFRWHSPVGSVAEKDQRAITLSIQALDKAGIDFVLAGMGDCIFWVRQRQEKQASKILKTDSRMRRYRYKP